jgi:hypothetical protein
MNSFINTKYRENPNYKLAKNISKVLIIACKEQTQQLEAVFTQEGFECQVLRQEFQPEYENFSRSYLSLMNHNRAWEIAEKETQPTMIVEADFVPVVGIAKLPLPFNPKQTNVGISWLYTCAPQVYSVSDQGYAEGFSSAAVAYIVTPKAAKSLQELALGIAEKYGATNYSTWDSTIDTFLRDRKFQNYIPWRNYGEHGGAPNPEHKQNKLSKTHRADVLYGKLAFMPIYANSETSQTMTLFFVRLQARLKGIGRVLLGRFLRPQVIQGSSVPTRLMSFALLRHFNWQP